MAQNSNFPVSLDYYNGSVHDTHYYAVDTSFEPYRREAFRHRSIPSQREAITLSNIVGQGTVATEGLWRREQVEWSMGAGQFSLDRKGDAQETRFSSSKGVDVFGFPLQAKLLPDTHQIISNTNTPLMMARCGGYLIVATSGAVTRYTYSAGSWGTATAFTVDTTYGGSSFGTINSLTTNDTYVFIATTTGVWFGAVTGTTLALYAAPDLNGTYNGGYDMVRWANDQIVASRLARLYAFQPRSATGVVYGSAPSSSTAQIQVKLISNGVSSGWVTTSATVYTTTPHGLTNGQSITIHGTQSYIDVITGISYTNGVVTVTSTGYPSGFQVGEHITVRLTFTTGRVITEDVVVASIVSGQSFTYNTTKVQSANVAHFWYGTASGSSADGFGYNNTYTVQGATPSPVTVSAVTPSTPGAGYVQYTTSSAHLCSVGDTITIAGVTPSGYSGTFVVDAVQSGTALSVVNATTGAATLTSATLTRASTSFTITCPTTAPLKSHNGAITVQGSADVLYTHQNSSWIWSDATGGETQVYITGYVKSSLGSYSGCVYRSNLLGSSTTQPSGISTVTNASVAQPWQLDTPVQALPMSPDEYPTCIKSYLNFIFIGTNRGIRMTQTLSVYDPTATATGDLKSGPLIPNILQPVTNPVQAIVGDGRFIWFGWSNYDGSSTGLGKLDLSTYIAGDPLAPAFASDLMVTGSGLITALEWDPANNVPLIAVQGSGIYSPYATNLGQGGNATVTQYVTSGTLVSGVFDYGIPDQKTPVFFDYNANVPGASTVGATVVFNPGDDNTSTQTLATYGTGGNPEVAFANNPYVKGKQFQVTMTLTRGAATVSPILHRWTLKAWPGIAQGTQISVVTNLNKQIVVDGKEVAQDSDSEYVWLDTRRLNQDIVTYTEGALSVLCTVVELDRIPHKLQDTYEGGFEGDCVIYLKTVAPYVLTEVSTL